MKPIDNSLDGELASAEQENTSASNVEESKLTAVDQQQQHQKQDRKSEAQAAPKPANSNATESISASSPIQSEVSNSSPLSVKSTSANSTSTQSNTVDDRMDKKLIGSSRETPLSVMKLSPFGLLGGNNKVGSSFQTSQQALATYAPQLAYLLPVTNRKVRDSGSMLFMLAFLGFLAYIIWDGINVKGADINLIVHGHDSYGNICGRNNRPIRYVEKSGRNYTSKPYTKYTLINSQFERYTLDSDRLKHGELFYVKQADLHGPMTSARDAFERAKLLTQLQLRDKRSAPIKYLQQQPQQQQSQSFLSSLPYEQMVKNQSLLRELKSTLMYQYPPLYGYHSPSMSAASEQAAAVSAAASVGKPPPPSPKQQQQQPLSSSNGKWQNMVRYREVAGVARPNSQGLTQPLEASASQTKPSFLSAMSSSSLAPPPLTSSPSSSLLPSFSDSAAAPPTPQTPFRRATTVQTVMFDDRVNDSDDRYEHTLVNPLTNSLRPRTPDGLNLYEVSNQLLYLTECVDYCPSDHVELIFFRCMPKNWRFSLFPNAINVTRTFIDDILTDMSHCYRELIYIFSFALVLSLALLVLLRFLASFIIWSCLTVLISLFLSTAIYSWFNYYHQIVDLNNSMPHDAIYADKLASSDKWLMGAIFLTFISFGTIGAVIFMRKRILLVTMLFRESGKAIADMPMLLLQPVLTFAALIGITVLWSIGLICLQSMKVPIIEMNTGFVVFKAETLYKVMKWYHIFAFLWVSHFAIACQHYVIGSAVSKWYFSTNKYDLHSPIGTSVSELILYYLGSVALGSFLVAIFKVIRIITRQIQFLVQRNCMSAATNSSGTSPLNGSPAALNSAQSLSSCGSLSYVWRLFIWFFDNIVMIINRDAYVEVAIHGHSFLAGAKQAFKVLASNPLKLLAIKSVSNILLVVAKICVVFGTISMAMILLDEKNNQLNYSWSPIVISATYAYIVAHWFLSVYEMVIDALFICYCEDHERSKSRAGSAANSITGSSFMNQVISNSNQIY